MARYMDDARADFAFYGLNSLRDLILLHDVAMQNGPVKVGEVSSVATRQAFERLGGMGLPPAKRHEAIANAVANTANPRWLSDVLSRKLMIVRGAGTVHGKAYNQERQYGPLDEVHVDKTPLTGPRCGGGIALGWPGSCAVSCSLPARAPPCRFPHARGDGNRLQLDGGHADQRPGDHRPASASGPKSLHGRTKSSSRVANPVTSGRGGGRFSERFVQRHTIGSDRHPDSADRDGGRQLGGAGIRPPFAWRHRNGPPACPTRPRRLDRPRYPRPRLPAFAPRCFTPLAAHPRRGPRSRHGRGR